MIAKWIRIVSLAGMAGLLSLQVLFAQQNMQSHSYSALALNNQVVDANGTSSFVSDLMQIPLNIDLQHITVEEALQEIVDHVGLDLKLMYGEKAVSNSKTVNVTYSSVTLQEALWKVLDGTDLQFAVSPSGQLILFENNGEFFRRAVQNGTITGTITDENSGEPLIGATIFIMETEQGTTTDVDGEFELAGIAPGTYTVRVTYIGYVEHMQAVDIAADDVLELDVSLQQDAVGLDELVVTGYGIRERREVTGAISSVRAEQISARPFQTADQALQGRSAGLQFVGGSGAPGSQSQIVIRGMGSINSSTTPLYIVDGIPLEDSPRANIATTNTSLLTSLNPADIESIDVLRDAEATAIYGAQGANGVVLITTRRGERGATQFTANARTGFSHFANTYEFISGPEFVEIMQEAAVNRAIDLGNDPEAARQNAINTYGHPDEVGTYDWFNALTRTGYNTRYSLSARGGTESTRFYVSGGYDDVQGSVISSSFERTTLRANLDHDATDRLSFSTNLNLSRSRTIGVLETGGNYINSPFHAAVTTMPTTPIYNEDGTYNQDIPAITYNMVQVLEEEDRISREFQFIGNVAATFNANENLAFRGQFNADVRISRDRRYQNPVIPRYAETGGVVFERMNENENYSGNIVADYINSFANVHNVSAILGAEYRVRDYRFFSGTGRQIPNPLLGYLNLAGEAFGVAGRTTQYKTAGAFSRFQYNYDQRYFASFNLRYDGHSRFGLDTRWGLFYSAGLAWDAAREQFMQDVTWVNRLRPRFSYGITGNAGIDDFASLALFGAGGTYMGNAGLRPSQLGNASLGWEQARSIDFAVDFALFEDRVYGNIGVYRTDNENLLLERFLPNDSGFSDIMENVGSLRNEGIEIELGAVILSYGNFSWSTETNLTLPRSEVLSLEGGQEWMSDPRSDIVNSRIYVGQPRHQWWVRNYAGVNPADGRTLWYDANGDLTYTVGTNDMMTYGSVEPDFFGGWSNQFSYGPVSVDIFFQYEFGTHIFDEQYSNFLLAPHRGRNLAPEIFERWQQPGDVTHIPKAYPLNAFPGGTPYHNMSNKRLYDGSYIRLKSINVSYQLPVELVQRLSLNSLTIFARAENLHTWTSYPGLDPEVFARNQTRYPLARSFEAGVEIRF